MLFTPHRSARPVGNDALVRRGGSADSTDYEKALRFNLSAAEKTALVEALGLLKGLHTALSSIAGEPELLIRRARSTCDGGDGGKVGDGNEGGDGGDASDGSGWQWMAVDGSDGSDGSGGSDGWA